MTCIIVDDEPHAIDVLERYVGQTPFLKLVGTFRNPLKAVGFLGENDVQLIFLDITMPQLSGVDMLKTLTYRPLVIFTTAYSEYAVQSYDLDAVDYLVKPIEFERFLKAATKALALQGPQVNNNADFITIKSGPQLHRIRTSEILFVEKDGNYLNLNTRERKILMRANMNDIFSWLPESLFCRIHKSYVVALSHIEVVESHQVIVSKMKIPLGPSYRDELMKKLQR